MYHLVTLMIARLTGNFDSLLLPTVTRWDHILIAQEKIKIQNSKFGFYRMLIAFAPPWSQKIITRTIVSQGLSLVTLWISEIIFHTFLLKNVFIVTKKKWAIKAWKTHRNPKYILLSKSNLKRTHTVWFQLYDIFENAKLWKHWKDQWFLGVGRVQ